MLKIFVDFDGTISKDDIGYRLFQKFAGDRTKDIVDDYLSEKLTAIEFYEKLTKSCNLITENELFAFIDAQKIDPTFIEFLHFCEMVNKENKILDICILSDGFDIYIKRVLNNHEINHVKFFANKLNLNNDGTLSAEFPYTDEECTRCACCKRNHILTLSADDDIIVYIGNGYSDQCAVNYADIVFARERLQTYCQQKNISYYLFNDFNDIISRLEKILKRKRIRKRQQAEFNRREAFLSG